MMIRAIISVSVVLAMIPEGNDLSDAPFVFELTDGSFISVSRKAFETIPILKALREINPDDMNPLSEKDGVTREMAELVFGFAEYHGEHGPLVTFPTPLTSTDLSSYGVSKFDLDLLNKHTVEELAAISFWADKLGVESLVELISVKFATLIIGQTRQQIIKRFNVDPRDQLTEDQVDRLEKLPLHDSKLFFEEEMKKKKEQEDSIKPKTSI
jgi:hypothetical protein